MTTFRFTVLCPGDPLVPLIDIRRSIFLAGPTPRSTEVKSWRPEALDILSQMGFDGIVLVPERPDWTVKFDYVDQVAWELEGLQFCDAIAFWVPRDMATMPALTTNVEFGMFVGSGRAVYGRPDGAPSTRYLDYLYRRIVGEAPYSTLADVMRFAAGRAS